MIPSVSTMAAAATRAGATYTDAARAHLQRLVATTETWAQEAIAGRLYWQLATAGPFGDDNPAVAAEVVAAYCQALGLGRHRSR